LNGEAALDGRLRLGDSTTDNTDMRYDRCPGSKEAPNRVLRAAERVLIGERVAAYRGRAVCGVCGAEVGLNLAGTVTVHRRSRA
jgi:hypothetical protein